jgi:hypothetical protein
MDWVWVGIQLAFGLAIGALVVAVVIRVAFRVRAHLVALRFAREDCVYQPSEAPGVPSGWLIRDIRNDDWLLWDENIGRALRMSDDAPPGEPWRASGETRKQFLALARREREHSSGHDQVPGADTR